MLGERTGPVHYDRIWAILERAVRHERVGAATKLAFLLLWTRSRGTSEVVSISARELGVEFGRSDRAARKWLERLEKVGWVRVLAREGDGRIRLEVCGPEAEA